MVEAYSPATKTHYDTWDALVEAETNGWVATLIAETKNGQAFTYTLGPYPEKRLATNASRRLRNLFKKEEPHDLVLLGVTVRPAWKELV
jgi:hypothetical protein